MSNATAPLMPTTGCWAPTTDAEKIFTSVVCALVIIAAATDMFLCSQRFTFFHGLVGRYNRLLMIPGLYAFAAGMMPWMTLGGPSFLLLMDIQSLLRVWYLFESVGATLAIFNLRGGGSFGSNAEAVERIGGLFEELQLPKQKIAPLVLLWCSLDYTPNRAFLRSCFRRMRLPLISYLFITVLRQLLVDLGVENKCVAPMPSLRSRPSHYQMWPFPFLRIARRSIPARWQPLALGLPVGQHLLHHLGLAHHGRRFEREAAPRCSGEPADAPADSDHSEAEHDAVRPLLSDRRRRPRLHRPLHHRAQPA